MALTSITIGATPPDITIGGPLGSGYDITLSWTGENGVAYGVQTNADLVDGIWNAYISNIIGDGGPIRSFLIEDPGGYTVEFFEWLESADQ